jgi:GxxExxY protein
LLYQPTDNYKNANKFNQKDKLIEYIRKNLDINLDIFIVNKKTDISKYESILDTNKLNNNNLANFPIRKTLASFKITSFLRKYNKDYLNIKISSQKVYLELGWGFNEKVYQEALKRELIETYPYYSIVSEVPRTIYYKGYPLGDGVYIRSDILITNRTTNKQILLELKADQASITSIKKARQQLSRYLSNNINQSENLKTGIVIIFPDKSGCQPMLKVIKN